MRILMLGNSFTFFNDMPDMLAELLCGASGDEQRPHYQPGVLFQQRHPPV